MDESWSSGTSSSWSSTRERVRRASLKRRENQKKKKRHSKSITIRTPQEQAIHERFGYLTGLISKEDLQEIIENEKKRREQRQLLDLVSRSDLQGILDREKRRRSSVASEEEIPTKKNKRKSKKRQSGLMSTFNSSSKRKHSYNDKPTMTERVTQLIPNVFNTNRRKSRSRKNEDEMYSKMESQQTSISTSVRSPYRYLFYVMVGIGVTGLILAVVAVVSYMNQQKEKNAPP